MKSLLKGSRFQTVEEEKEAMAIILKELTRVLPAMAWPLVEMFDSGRKLLQSWCAVNPMITGKFTHFLTLPPYLLTYLLTHLLTHSLTHSMAQDFL
jgi:hypothetical protein